MANVPGCSGPMRCTRLSSSCATTPTGVAHPASRLDKCALRSGPLGRSSHSLLRS